MSKAAEPVAEIEDSMGIEETFTCYNCRDGVCDDCVGIPCQCPCPLGPRDKNFEEEYF